MDASEAMLERARSDAAPGIRPVAMDVAAFAGFPVRYDKILLRDALVHVAEGGVLLARLRERLAPGGRLR